MPYDPTLPANGTRLRSAEMRGQFSGIVELITSIPRGEKGDKGDPGQNGSDGVPGPQGQQGPAFAQAVIDAVQTLNASENAQVSVHFDGTLVHFTFSIPRGSEGPVGAQGPPGEVTAQQLTAALLTAARHPGSVSPLTLTPSTTYDPAALQAVIAKLEELRAALVG